MGSGAAAVDLVGAMLMSGCGICFARNSRAVGVFVGFLAVCCAVVTAYGIFGYQSSNRIAVAKHKAAIGRIDTDQLEWLKNQTTSSAKGERQTMLGEVKEQVKAIKNGDIIVGDTQSSELAAAFGTTEDEVRRWTTMGMAGILLGCQFACLWLNGFLRHRIEPDAATPPNWQVQAAYSNGTTPKNPALDAPATKFSLVQAVGARIGRFNEEQALADLTRRLAAGEEPLAKDMAVAWKRPVNTVSMWINKWERQMLLSRKQKGTKKLIRAPASGLQMTGTA